jgi:hypothetical protein
VSEANSYAQAMRQVEAIPTFMLEAMAQGLRSGEIKLITKVPVNDAAEAWLRACEQRMAAACEAELTRRNAQEGGRHDFEQPARRQA